MATYVLVHGAFFGGFCWRWVVPHLRDAGHEVYSPTLTGLGERIHLASPQVGIDTHIQDITNLFEYEDLTDVILVGFSYGGTIVAGVADRRPDRIAHLIYLDSDVPRDGDTSVPPSQHAARQLRATAEGDGWRAPLPSGFIESQLADLPEATRRWVIDRVAMHPLRTWLEPIHLSGVAAAIPTTYIRCTVGDNPDDEDTARQDARVRSEPTWRYRQLAAQHFAPITHPRAVADLLLEATGEWRVT